MTRVRLMAEYCCDFPVWIDHEEAAPSAIADDTLRQRIERWNLLFLDHFDACSGWDDESVRQRYSEEADQLVAALEQHFGDAAQVTHDPWPLETSESSPGNRQ